MRGLKWGEAGRTIGGGALVALGIAVLFVLALVLPAVLTAVAP